MKLAPKETIIIDTTDKEMFIGILESFPEVNFKYWGISLEKDTTLIYIPEDKVSEIIRPSNEYMKRLLESVNKEQENNKE
jgi:hypothetical protein